MANRPPFEVDEWYHCFNRGVEKRKVFDNEYDANRFLMLLYLANGSKAISLFNTYKPTVGKAFDFDRGNTIVDIGAYCLMPNHFHLLIKEVQPGSISSFMRRLGIGYAMYFNAKYERVGNVFLRPFRSRHVSTDTYFQRVVQYIHLNPAELYESNWKSGTVMNLKRLEKNLIDYQYSSLSSYADAKRISPILSKDVFRIAVQMPLSRMLSEAQSYYRQVMLEKFER